MEMCKSYLGRLLQVPDVPNALATEARRENGFTLHRRCRRFSGTPLSPLILFSRFQVSRVSIPRFAEEREGTVEETRKLGIGPGFE